MSKRSSSSIPAHYDYLLRVALADLSSLYQVSQVFILTNTVILGFVLPKIIDNNGNIVVKFSSGYFLLSLVGLTVSFLWFLSYRRISKYYNFRLAQLRALEPNGWNIYAGDGFNIASGKDVTISGYKYQMKYSLSNNKVIVPTIILLFILIHSFVLFCTFPW